MITTKLPKKKIRAWDNHPVSQYKKLQAQLSHVEDLLNIAINQGRRWDIEYLLIESLKIEAKVDKLLSLNPLPGSYSEMIKLTTHNGDVIELTESEVLAMGWHYQRIMDTRKLDESDISRAHEIIANRANVKEPADYGFLDAQELALYKHLLTDSERAKIDKAFQDHNQGKVIYSDKPNKKGICKGLVQIPIMGRFSASHAGRLIPKLDYDEIEGDIVGEYVVSKGNWGWEVSHIKTGLSMLQTEKLKDYQRRNNMSAYQFKKVQAMEIATWLDQKNLAIGNSYNDLVKRVKKDRQEVIDNLISVFSPVIDDVAFRP